MRVIKKLYSKDPKTIAASRIFDDLIANTDLPLNFEVLEFSFGYGFTSINEDKVSIGIDLEDPLLEGNDIRSIRTLINFELHRVYVRKKLGKNVPRVAEDILVGRDMVREFSDDMTYVFYSFVHKHRIRDIKDYIRINMPWLIFFGKDNYSSEMFRQFAKQRSRPGYELKLKKLFNSLKKDLYDEKNLNSAIKAYEDVLHAGD